MLDGVPGVDAGVILTEENFAPSGKPATVPRPSFDDEGDTLHPTASSEGDRFRVSCLILFAKFLVVVTTDGVGSSRESSSANLSSEEDEVTLEAPSLPKLLLLVALGVLLFLVLEVSSGRSSAGEHKAPAGNSQP